MASNPKKIPKKTLTLGEKIEVIKRYERGGIGARTLAGQYGVGKTQIQNIVNRKHEYLDDFENNAPVNKRRKLLHTGNDEINKLCWEFYCDTTSRLVTCSGPLLQEQALNFANDLGVIEFKASNGWLESFKKRHNLGLSTMVGESAGVDNTVADDWKEKLPQIIDGYAPQDVYNMDESGLFYRATSTKTLFVKDSSLDEILNRIDSTYKDYSAYEGNDYGEDECYCYCHERWRCAFDDYEDDPCYECEDYHYGTGNSLHDYDPVKRALNSAVASARTHWQNKKPFEALIVLEETMRSLCLHQPWIEELLVDMFVDRSGILPSSLKEKAMSSIKRTFDLAPRDCGNIRPNIALGLKSWDDQELLAVLNGTYNSGQDKTTSRSIGNSTAEVIVVEDNPVDSSFTEDYLVVKKRLHVLESEKRWQEAVNYIQRVNIKTNQFGNVSWLKDKLVTYLAHLGNWKEVHSELIKSENSHYQGKRPRLARMDPTDFLNIMKCFTTGQGNRMPEERTKVILQAKTVVSELTNNRELIGRVLVYVARVGKCTEVQEELMKEKQDGTLRVRPSKAVSQIGDDDFLNIMKALAENVKNLWVADQLQATQYIENEIFTCCIHGLVWNDKVQHSLLEHMAESLRKAVDKSDAESIATRTEGKEGKAVVACILSLPGFKGNGYTYQQRMKNILNTFKQNKWLLTFLLNQPDGPRGTVVADWICENGPEILDKLTEDATTSPEEWLDKRDSCLVYYINDIKSVPTCLTCLVLLMKSGSDHITQLLSLPVTRESCNSFKSGADSFSPACPAVIKKIAAVLKEIPSAEATQFLQKAQSWLVAESWSSLLEVKASGLLRNLPDKENPLKPNPSMQNAKKKGNGASPNLSKALKTLNISNKGSGTKKDDAATVLMKELIAKRASPDATPMEWAESDNSVKASRHFPSAASVKSTGKSTDKHSYGTRSKDKSTAQSTGSCALAKTALASSPLTTNAPVTGPNSSALPSSGNTGGDQKGASPELTNIVSNILELTKTTGVDGAFQLIIGRMTGKVASSSPLAEDIVSKLLKLKGPINLKIGNNRLVINAQLTASSPVVPNVPPPQPAQTMPNPRSVTTVPYVDPTTPSISQSAPQQSCSVRKILKLAAGRPESAAVKRVLKLPLLTKAEYPRGPPYPHPTAGYRENQPLWSGRDFGGPRDTSPQPLAPFRGDSEAADGTRAQKPGCDSREVNSTGELRIDVCIHEPLWVVPVTRGDVAVEIVTLCSQLELLCEKEMNEGVSREFLSQDRYRKSLSPTFESQAMVLIGKMREALNRLPQPPAFIQDYLQSTSLAGMFPRAAAYIANPQTLYNLGQQGSMDEYFQHMASLHLVSSMCRQLNSDVNNLTNHKYIAHQVALLYQSVSPLGSRGPLAAHEKAIKQNFNNIKQVLTVPPDSVDPPRLPPDQAEWVKWMYL
uniref:HTH CENPB-type domain-containing protein n=1 Tax=Branchiostoma floridae TaxID=7739 RepID=C3ZWX2_BRAFL|eukprot:XP_002586923.1 hypothetical protein BRAFLDRAFT_130452 [Branchiostoma floridae]